MSSSLCSSFQALLMPPRQKMRFFVFIHSNKFLCFPSRFVASFTNDDSLPLPKHSHPPFDSSVDLYGLLDPRNVVSGAPEPRSWFGPNGQYIKELPCPSCRGRGYAPCTECGIERSRLDCSVCNGKGAVTCHQCSGNRVIWEEFIDERPWETARSISPLRMKEDDEVDNLDIKLEEKKKSKRVYQSPPPEVGLKISRSLKSLNAKTGLFSKRMKIIHRDPTLHAQRVAAIKKAKGSAEARKRTSEALKAFFSDPENRRKRSISMKGVKFYCNNCGREGHRRYYCPELKGDSVDRRFRCRVCGEKGHNKRTCKKSRLNNKTNATMQYHCRICGVKGHNRRTCLKSELSKPKGIGRNHRCGICRQNGHYRQNCPIKLGLNLINVDRTVNQNSRVRQSHCRICNKKGHNRRKCPNFDGKANHSTSRRAYSCKLCNEKGHNSRTCHSRNVNDSQKNPPVNLIE